MSTDPLIVAELRAMFLNGATPSRLIRHLAGQYETEAAWPSHVGVYFAEAFGVAVEVARTNVYAVRDDLLRDMVGRSDAWNDEAGGWWGGLSVAADDLELIEGIRPESHPALADCWAALSPEARAAIRQAMVNARGYYERFKVLERLVERLQHQVTGLEIQVGDRGVVELAASP